MRISGKRLAGALLTAAVSLAGCAPPERPLLDRFFDASRLRDLTALQAVSTVVFEPREQGIVRTFQITGITPERPDGQTVAKEVTVVAPVILPDGQTIQKTLVMTIQRVNGERPGRWLVTGFRDAAASRPAPRS